MLVVRAPGRVNLIGDHTDYQDGLCLPMAIDREVFIRAEPRADGRVTIRSDALGGVVELPADGLADPRSSAPAWGRPVAAVLRLLSQPSRPMIGFDATVTSTVPVGAGLASSAAFAVAVAMTASEIGDLGIAPRSIALVAQAAELAATGVPCGLMDQMASLFGRRGHALLLDCRTLEIEPVALPDSAAVVVVHSGVARRLEDSAYEQRRAGCAVAAARIGVETLRDASLDQVVDDPFAHHVVTENQRVTAFGEALRGNDLTECGRLMAESHASLRDRFRVSTIELDALVEELTRVGAYGARLTGAGFGGCVVALVAAGDADTVVEPALARYRSATGRTPSALHVHAVDGAGSVQ